MPYPESCPECGGAFRNTGTHFTARRNEIGRHVLLELGCQNTSLRFWWDFTTGQQTAEGRPSPVRRSMPAALGAASATHGVPQPGSNGHGSERNGYGLVSTLERFAPSADAGLIADPGLIDDNAPATTAAAETVSVADPAQVVAADQDPALQATSVADLDVSRAAVEDLPTPALAHEETLITDVVELTGPPPLVPAALKDAFARQLQLDRLTMRQMRSWLMSDDARRAIEVAAGATEATYERLALTLFGVELPQLLGTEAAINPSPGMSAEQRLELQREKARIRARLRRAAAKAARQDA